jgi:hypothetical protein
MNKQWKWRYNMFFNTLLVPKTSSGSVGLLIILSIAAIFSFIVLVYLYKNRNNKIDIIKPKTNNLKISFYDFESVLKVITDCSFKYYPKTNIVELNDELNKLITPKNINPTVCFDEFDKYISDSYRDTFSETLYPIKNNDREIDSLDLQLVNSSKETIDVKCLLFCSKKDLLNNCEIISGYIVAQPNIIKQSKVLSQINDYELMMQEHIGMGYWQYDNDTKKVYLSISAANLYFGKNSPIIMDIQDFLSIFSADSATEMMIKLSESSKEYCIDYDLIQYVSTPNGLTRRVNVICRSFFERNELVRITAMSFQIPYEKSRVNQVNSV